MTSLQISSEPSPSLNEKQPQAPLLTEDEIDDLIYLARTGDVDDLSNSINLISSRTSLSALDVILEAKDEDGQTPLHMAAGNGHLATTTLLISHFSTSSSLSTSLVEKKRAFLNAQNSFGNTPLHWAAERGQVDVVKFLISSGADPTVANSKGDIPLDSAQFGMREEVTAYFLSQNEDLEKAKSGSGKEQGDEEELVITMGDVNVKDESGEKI